MYWITWMRFSQFIIFVLIGFLSGCSVDPASQVFIDAFHLNGGESTTHSGSNLNPNFSYLRVQIGKRAVFMVLGYVDKDRDGDVEVWYSALGEVLRLRDGRLVGATMNMGTDWLSVSFKQLPRWNQIGAQTVFERDRDISPGYQYGIQEKMHIQPVTQPKDSQLQLIQPSSLTWFEEFAEGPNALPAARYAVSMNAIPQVIYAEQCLSNDFCFSWQRWTPKKESGH
jgi:hypothetical protein